MRIINISDAKASLSKLIEQVQAGDEVVIGKAGKPVAKLVRFELDATPRNLSQRVWQGQVWIAEDFDDLPEEFLSAFSGMDADEPTP
ncbi:MAG: type II toxin-antitoxin system prevent-host-death family antitoxin [Trueperaceae bacterium]